MDLPQSSLQSVSTHHMRLIGLVVTTLTAVSMLFPILSSAAPVAAEHVTVELISETETVQPGKQAWVGLKLVHEPHWHTYWINPGDSGLPTRFSWELPKGFQAGAIDWPAPRRFELSDMYNFGYDATVLLPVAIDVPANAPLNSKAHLVLNAKWLICDDQCIPGGATLSLDLMISSQTPKPIASHSPLFAAARAVRAQRITLSGQARVIPNKDPASKDANDRVRIELKGSELRNIVVSDVFPVAGKLLSTTPATFTHKDDQLIIDAQINDYFEASPASIELVLSGKAANSSQSVSSQSASNQTASSQTVRWQFTVPWIDNRKK